MKLLNLQTGQYEDVPDDRALMALKSGQYGGDDHTWQTVLDPEGNPFDVRVDTGDLQ